MTRPSFAPASRHQIALAAALITMVLVALILSPGRALAGVSGQIGDAWNPPTEVAGEAITMAPTATVDPSDGNVFVVAANTEFTEEFLLDLSDTGHLEGSVKLPGVNTTVGLAVDPHLERLYVLIGAKMGSGTAVTKEATKILAYSTTPTGEQLVPAAPGELPLPTGSEALHSPQEIVVDPSTGDLVVLATEAKEEKQLTTLQRIEFDPITGAAVMGEKFFEEEGTEGPPSARAIAIDEAGVTYLVGQRDILGSRMDSAETLPAQFSASSELTPVPGFAALQLGSATISVPTKTSLPNRGPQVAVTTSSTGEDTLYWKDEIANGTEYLIEGYSVDGEARAGAFGGGTAEGECRISYGGTALTGEENGDLAVFDQGQAPSLPVAYQFGSGGSGCPAPAPAFKLESGGQTVSSVSVGSTVTFNGTETELNAAPSVEGGAWKVEGPCGFTEPITGSPLTFDHKFIVPGNYKIRMMIEAETGALGRVFSAQPQTLTVTGGSGSTPNVDCVSPDEGPTVGGTEVTIGGTNLAGATEVTFGSVAVPCTGVVTTCKVESDSEIKATAPVLDPGTVEVHVVTGAGESPANAPVDQFTAVGPPPPTFTLTVSKAGSGTGTVTSSPARIKCGVTCAASFNEKTSVTLSESPSSGSTFAGWGGACSGTATSCVVTMDAAKTVTATFEANSTPPAETPTTPSEVKPAPIVTPPPGPAPGPKPKNKAEILAAQRKAALKKCQKLKGKGKAMCVKKADQIGKPKPKPKKAKKPKK